RGRKDSLQQLVARIGSAAAAHENSFGLFISALNHLAEPVSPETAIRGLLQRGTPEATRDLLHDVIVWSLVTETGGRDGARRGQAPEGLMLSATLVRDLQRGLGDDFPRLGMHVWDRAGDRFNDPAWCDAWARMAQEILQHAELPETNRAVELSDEYARR